MHAEAFIICSVTHTLTCQSEVTLGPLTLAVTHVRLCVPTAEGHKSSNHQMECAFAAFCSQHDGVDALILSNV